MNRSSTGLAVVAGAVLLLAGCSDSDGSPEGLTVSGAYIPQPVSADMAAGFLTISNSGSSKDELTSVTSDDGQVTMHETNGGAMEEVSRLAVPAHGQLVFKSGANHLMFDKLKQAPKQGQTVTVELHFAKADPVVVKMPVKSATYVPKTGH
ncbi:MULTISPECIES: copper chaperone PCu(A)C [unclassified Streptomyces]|uniref:copper chaperone PCu(A)C n=1 Tax=unclassified Streptomyces TaxID=2593676 RepID=UPI0024733BE3|nr:MULTISPECIES: copper chaperone PCu(A)C [unclassified Streptomyces]MDH6451343.1 copper(I)-binding protein [Streptomyces sp. SAI-119]MDH6498098.1 copper(I)-binding protein [Streptomyces sp. SAI-149]